LRARALRQHCGSISKAAVQEAFRQLTDAEAEAAETQVWMELAWMRGYTTQQEFDEVFDLYEKLLGQLVLFSRSPNPLGNPEK
jgi:four helix bundle protein